MLDAFESSSSQLASSSVSASKISGSASSSMLMSALGEDHRLRLDSTCRARHPRPVVDLRSGSRAFADEHVPNKFIGVLLRPTGQITSTNSVDHRLRRHRYQRGTSPSVARSLSSQTDLAPAGPHRYTGNAHWHHTGRSNPALTNVRRPSVQKPNGHYYPKALLKRCVEQLLVVTCFDPSKHCSPWSELLGNDAHI